MKPTQSRLIELVAGRLNHNYISPLTAISNAVTLLQLSDDTYDAAIEIIVESLANAIGELEYNRVAFGTSGDDEQMSIGTINRLLNNFIGTSENPVELTVANGNPMRRHIKLLFLGLLCVRASFLKIDFLSIENKNASFNILAEGRTLLDDSGDPRMDADWIGARTPTSNTVQFPLFNIECEAQDFDYVKKQRENALTLKIWKKTF